MAKPSIPNPVQGTCGCGCGEPVRGRFVAGHDARLKSALLEVARHGSSANSEKAAWLMVNSGWGKFVDDDILDRLPMRNSKGQRKQHINLVVRWIVSPLGHRHCNASCPHLTAEAKAMGHIHPITKLARPSYTSFSYEAPVGFEICTTCTAEETVLEQVQRTTVRQWLVLEALDAEWEQGLGPSSSKSNRAKSKTKALEAAALKGWSVEADTDEFGNILPIREAA